MSLDGFRSIGRQHAYQLTGGRCFYCFGHLAHDGEHVACGNGFIAPPGKVFFEVDHKIPRCQGGRDHLSNYVPACGKCNGQKGGKTADEYRAWLQNKHRGPVRFFEDVRA